MQVRFITPDEAQACNDFHNRLFGDARTLKQWQWLFMPRSFSADHIPFVVVDDNGRIRGTQAFIPVRMIDKRGVFWTVKSEETLLEPEYRGKGLPAEMYRMLIDEFKGHDLHCVWGFTAATAALTRAGFSTPGTTSQLFFPFRAAAVTRGIEGQTPHRGARSSGKTRIAAYKTGCLLACKYSSFRFALDSRRWRNDSSRNAIDFRTLHKPPAESGTLCERFIERWGGVTIYRDVQYLKWRLFDNPFARSVFRAAYVGDALIGWIAYTMGDDGMGYIVDLLVVADDDAVVRTTTTLLLRDAVTSLRNMGALGVRGWHVTGYPFDVMATELAKNLGFYHVKRGYKAVLMLSEDSDRKETLAAFDNWYVTRIFTEGVSG